MLKKSSYFSIKNIYTKLIQVSNSTFFLIKMGLNAFKIILSIRVFFRRIYICLFALYGNIILIMLSICKCCKKFKKQSYLQEYVTRFLFIVKTSKLDMTISLLIIDIIHIKFYGYIKSKIHVW